MLASWSAPSPLGTGQGAGGREDSGDRTVLGEVWEGTETTGNSVRIWDG